MTAQGQEHGKLFRRGHGFEVAVGFDFAVGYGKWPLFEMGIIIPIHAAPGAFEIESLRVAIPAYEQMGLGGDEFERVAEAAAEGDVEDGHGTACAHAPTA